MSLQPPDHGFRQLIPPHGCSFLGEHGLKLHVQGDVPRMEPWSFAILLQLHQNWKLKPQFTSLVLWQKANDSV